MNKNSKITYSAPGKIHFLGEHTVVHGKPALLAATNLRIAVTISHLRGVTSASKDSSKEVKRLRETVENVVKNKFKLKKIPAYTADIRSQIPIGAGMGSSAASSSAYLASLLTFLKIDWDLNLINELAYECDKVFNGNPSGGDNTTVVKGGFIWFRKEADYLKIFSPLPFSLHPRVKPFLTIDSGKPVESTAEMVAKVKAKLYKSSKPNPDLSIDFQPRVVKLFDHQEQLVKDLARALKEGNEDLLIKVIRLGEKNLEKLGVVGKIAKSIIREIEKIGGAGKIMGGGGISEGSGMLLAYHKNPKKLETLSKKENWKSVKIKLGGEGLRKERVSS